MGVDEHVPETYAMSTLAVAGVANAMSSSNFVVSVMAVPIIAPGFNTVAARFVMICDSSASHSEVPSNVGIMIGSMKSLRIMLLMLAPIRICVVVEVGNRDY